mmetsp:Transcript_18564/g.59113  ORF Transcript_18564/g.59113 Transcript_18564/m.59113 type:complete len:218 (+) Transcript_18564:114-767(+)
MIVKRCSRSTSARSVRWANGCSTASGMVWSLDARYRWRQRRNSAGREAAETRASSELALVAAAVVVCSRGSSRRSNPTQVRQSGSDRSPERRSTSVSRSTRAVARTSRTIPATMRSPPRTLDACRRWRESAKTHMSSASSSRPLRTQVSTSCGTSSSSTSNVCCISVLRVLCAPRATSAANDDDDPISSHVSLEIACRRRNSSSRVPTCDRVSRSAA